MRLDLGSGQVGPREGFEGVDRYEYEGVDWTCDLEHIPWYLTKAGERLTWKEYKVSLGTKKALESDSVDAIHCAHLVEHIRDLNGFMAEMWRVCKDGAEVEISHPYQFNVRAWQDPTHVRALNELSFFYWDKQWPGPVREEFGDTDFGVMDMEAILEPPWAEAKQRVLEKDGEEAAEEFVNRAARNQINVISDLRWILRCRK